MTAKGWRYMLSKAACDVTEEWLGGEGREWLCHFVQSHPEGRVGREHDPLGRVSVEDVAEWVRHPFIAGQFKAYCERRRVPAAVMAELFAPQAATADPPIGG